MTANAFQTVTDTHKPIRRDKVRHHELDHEAVLYDIAHHAVHYLNTTAYYIWTRCTGDYTVNQLAEMVMAQFGEPESDDQSLDRVRKDVRLTLAQLEENGLIDWDQAQDD